MVVVMRKVKRQSKASEFWKLNGIYVSASDVSQNLSTFDEHAMFCTVRIVSVEAPKHPQLGRLCQSGPVSET